MADDIDALDYYCLARHYRLTLEIIRDSFADSQTLRRYASEALENERAYPVAAYGEYAP